MGKVELIDGAHYVVVFNNKRDCVEAIYIKEHNLFSHFMGSVHVADADSYVPVKSNDFSSNALKISD